MDRTYSFAAKPSEGEVRVSARHVDLHYVECGTGAHTVLLIPGAIGVHHPTPLPYSTCPFFTPITVYFTSGIRSNFS